MNCIQWAYDIFKPVSVAHKHCYFEENDDSGSFRRDFMTFDASGVSITTVSSARRLAAAMGKILFPRLNRLIASEPQPEKRELYKRTRAWVRKKTTYHPYLVEKCMKNLLKKQKKTKIRQLPLAYREIYTDLCIVSVLHDIGRLSEVDLVSGLVCMKRSGIKKNHSVIGYEILEKADIKPEILLAIRYHEFAAGEELRQDALYNSLSEQRRVIAEYYTLALQDMDKTANLLERAKYGIAKCAEFSDPHYLQDYEFTEQYINDALNGKYLNIKGGHLLDAMARFVTWTYSVHFEETKAILSGVLVNFFEQMYKEAKREYNAAATKNPDKLSATYSLIAKLENYAIRERLGIEACSRTYKKYCKI